MYCKRCHYDLRATVEGKCPECGREFDRSNPRTFLPALTRPGEESIGYTMPLLLPAAATLAAGLGVMCGAGRIEPGAIAFVAYIMYKEAVFVPLLAVAIGMALTTRKWPFLMPLQFLIVAVICAWSFYVGLGLASL